MFRFVTDLKGFIIDIDSFSDCDLTRWESLQEKYECLFLTTKEATKDGLVALFGEKVYMIQTYERKLGPNKNIHYKSLEQLGLCTSEVAYISTDIDFLNQANGFMSGTVWITNRVTYDEASRAPDLICDSVEDMEACLDKKFLGFCGETSIYPNQKDNGYIVHVDFEAEDGMVVPLFMLGRYFGHNHYMDQLHPYSAAISLNKSNSERRAYGKFNGKFAGLYSGAIKCIQETWDIDGICAVPARPGRASRFQEILTEISTKCNIENLSENFMCIKDYPSQRQSSGDERKENIKNAFQYDGDLSQKCILIIDDVISTGATMKACVRQLKEAGAKQILIIVLAVNQLNGLYWSSDPPQSICPQCGEKMRLLVNSNDLRFFYSCPKRHGTQSFMDERKKLLSKINARPEV